MEQTGNTDSEEAMQLLKRIETYLKRSRTPPTRFGRDALGDPCFVFDLRAGREPRAATVERVTAWLDRCEARVG
jgi:hypothetical protein